MLIVGLTGGLACGKTFVSRELARLGCHIIQADLLGHEVLARGGEGYDEVVSRFGATILDANGDINRPSLAQIVFNDATELEALNAIVHPAVRRREHQILAQLAEDDPAGIAVIEAAILIEAGQHRRFDFLIVATCSESLQLDRALLRDPAMRRSDIEARIAKQMPLAAKRAVADFLIDTSGTPEATLAQTHQLYSLLQSMAAQSASRTCQNGKGK